MSKNFYIADTHFGHSNIIRLDNRHFKNEVNKIDKGWIHWAKENTNRYPEAALLKQL